MDTFVKAFLLTLGIFLASGCAGEPNGSESGDCDGCLGNPASIHCERLGYRLEIRSSDHGDTGVCVFPDGTECEEWSFFDGTCGVERSAWVQLGYSLDIIDNLPRAVAATALLQPRPPPCDVGT